MQIFFTRYSDTDVDKARRKQMQGAFPFDFTLVKKLP